MITSLQNDKVKYARALQRRRRVRHRERRLVFEGLRLTEEALRARASLDFAFYTEAAGADSRGEKLLEALRETGVPCFQVSESVMIACSDTESPQGLLAVLPFPDLPHPERPTLSLILDRVRDPGNLGTILRTALATGVEQVLLAPGTADFSNPKVVRAAMGAHLRLPVSALGWRNISETIAGCEVWLAAPDGDASYRAVDWTRPTALIIGSEAFGAGEQAHALAQGRVSIPMTPGVESLNTAVATAVILFKIMEQRTADKQRPAT